MHAGPAFQGTSRTGDLLATRLSRCHTGKSGAEPELSASVFERSSPWVQAQTAGEGRPPDGTGGARQEGGGHALLRVQLPTLRQPRAELCVQAGCHLLAVLGLGARPGAISGPGKPGRGLVVSPRSAPAPLLSALWLCCSRSVASVKAGAVPLARGGHQLWPGPGTQLVLVNIVQRREQGGTCAVTCDTCPRLHAPSSLYDSSKCLFNDVVTIVVRSRWSATGRWCPPGGARV